MAEGEEKKEPVSTHDRYLLNSIPEANLRPDRKNEPLLPVLFVWEAAFPGREEMKAGYRMDKDGGVDRTTDSTDILP
jgi:hypothetical protein